MHELSNVGMEGSGNNLGLEGPVGDSSTLSTTPPTPRPTPPMLPPPSLLPMLPPLLLPMLLPLSILDMVLLEDTMDSLEDVGLSEVMVFLDKML